MQDEALRCLTVSGSGWGQGEGFRVVAEGDTACFKCQESTFCGSSSNGYVGEGNEGENRSVAFS